MSYSLRREGRLECEATAALRSCQKECSMQERLRKIELDSFPAVSYRKMCQTLPTRRQDFHSEDNHPRIQIDLEDYAIMKDKTNPDAYKWDRDASGQRARQLAWFHIGRSE